MKLLAIESSAGILSVAAFESGSMKRELQQEARMRHVEGLAPLVSALLQELGWKASQLGTVAVSLGPGSFTGLRTGLAFAKGLCFANKATLVGVPTLEAWAEGEGEVEVWLDARRGFVYRGAYRQGIAVKEAQMIPLETARQECPPGMKILGDIKPAQGQPSAAKVGRLALKRMEAGGTDDAATLQPLYLRRTEVEILWEKHHPPSAPESYRFEALEEADLDEVVAIESQAFGTPWSKALFAEELKQKNLCYWFKARDPKGPHRVCAYMGFWKAVDEAHITNLAVRPALQRQGLGRALVKHLLDQAKALGCVRATLEVRPGNLAALRLYESFGFTGVALRPKYYLDNEEDALIMWKNEL